LRGLDVPDGGKMLVYRSIFVKGPDAERDEMIGFTAESGAHSGALVLGGVTVINHRAHGIITIYNRCRREPMVLQHVTFVGVPPQRMG
jgi:hypothetical protein